MKTRIFAFIWFCLTSVVVSAQIDFAAPVQRMVGSSVESVAIGDVNNDGLSDALVATSFYFDPDHDYSIFVFLQQPDGSMAVEPVRYPYSTNYGSWTVIQVADVNNDNRNDVVFTFGDSLGVMYQNSFGTLGPVYSMYSGSTADGIDTGDLNNDGLTDIAVCHWNDAFIKVFYQQASGGFQSVQYPVQNAGWDELNINDMNGDGLDDIVYMPGQMNGPAVYIFYQDIETGIPDTPVPYSYQHDYWTRFHGIATGDLNNDGRNDLVGTMGGNEAWIAIVYQNQDGTLGEATFLPSYDIPTPVEIADLNCDGKNEIIVGHDAWSHFSVWEQDAQGAFSGYKLFGSLYYVGPYGLAVGDMNSDMRQDVLTTSGYSTNYLIYNTSAPEGTLPIDTLITYTSFQADTINSWDNAYLDKVTSRVGECLLETTYRLNVTTYYIHEWKIGDTLFPRNFQICGLNQSDTLKSHFNFYRYFNDYRTDSTIIAVDTLVENMVITNVMTIYDTLNVVPGIQDDVRVVVSYHYTSDTLYMFVDSLRILTYLNEIEYLEIIRSAYEGLKCGIPVTDTLVTFNHLWNSIVMGSDTTLISHTVIAYPLGVDQRTALSGVRLYPNPARNDFILEIPEKYAVDAPFDISLISMDGKLMRRMEINDGSKLRTVINGGNLPRGVYTVFIQGRTQSGAVKVILSE
jgi:hypothetical protein